MSEQPRIPKVGQYVRGVGTLVEVATEQPPPPPPKTLYVFEEIKAEWYAVFGTDRIHGASMWDFYGKGTSVESAIKEAKRYMKRNKIGPRHPVEVRVVKHVKRFKREQKDGENFYDKTFTAFSDRVCVGDIDEVDTVVWSSRKK